MTDARGITASYSYDALNRLTNVTYPNSSENVTYNYDSAPNFPAPIPNACHEVNDNFAVGRLCEVLDESGQTNYNYDVWGNVGGQARQELGQVFTTLYEYDEANRVIQMTYPSGRVVDYQRDAIGRLIGTTTTDTEGVQTPIITDRTYRADGLWTQQTYGSGLIQSKTYDQQGRLTEHQVSGTAATNEYSRQYTYDANGNITRENSLDFLYDTDYQYDVLDRLDQELDSIASLTRNFQYDANGNRLEESEGTNGNTQITPLLYTPNSNRVETIDGQTITLDASGRTLQDGAGRTYTYNDAGRIKNITMNGQVVGEYIYNSQQLRTRKTVASDSGAQTILFHYDLAGNMIAEGDDQGNITQEYFYSDGERIAGYLEQEVTNASPNHEFIGPVTNISLGKSTVQSSTTNGGVSSRAVDGDTNGNWGGGSVTHSLNQSQSWWEVDLGRISSVQSVNVYNRVGCCTNRLSDFYVLVSETPFDDRSLTDLLADASIESTFHAGELPSASISLAFTNAIGRYVRVQLQGQNYLSLAEVEVMGIESNQSTNNSTNLSLGKTPTQSSTINGGVPSRAVDGNNNGDWSAGSVTHTSNQVQPWWQVDLEDQSNIDSVRIYNRVGCCTNRLSDFYVLVSDAPFGARTLNDLLADSSVDSVFHAGQLSGVSTKVELNNANGRYVRVQLQGQNYLSLAEVEVLGPVAATTSVSQAIQYYVNDHLNTPQQLINQNNETTWEAEYEAFGEATITTQLVTNNHRFPGQYYDEETNLHYNWNRYYDPAIGRYITSDPIGLQGGINTYGYVSGNPLRYYDPNGLILKGFFDPGGIGFGISRGLGVAAPALFGPGPRSNQGVSRTNGTIRGTTRGLGGSVTAGFGVTGLIAGSAPGAAAALPFAMIGIGSFEATTGFFEVLESNTGINVHSELVTFLITRGFIPDPFNGFDPNCYD